MNKRLLTGTLVRLSALNPEKDSTLFSQWSSDSEYGRLLDVAPVRLLSHATPPEWIANPSSYLFMIRTLNDDAPIGFTELDGIAWHHGDAWVGIGIGSREHWDRGYGSDALRVLLRYAFTELNLHRLSLSVFEYNSRAMHTYEKVGFRVEGRKRCFLHREGRRWDLMLMGILKSEWEGTNEPQA